MRTRTIAALLETRGAGQIFSLTIEREAKTRVACPFKIVKVTDLQGQMCTYSARTPVKTAIAAGDRGEPSLPSHIVESFFVGNVRFWRGRNGKEYLPVVLFGKNMKTEWYSNGRHTTKDTIKDYLLASELQTHGESEEGQVPFIAVNVDNVISIR